MRRILWLSAVFSGGFAAPYLIDSPERPRALVARPIPALPQPPSDLPDSPPPAGIPNAGFPLPASTPERFEALVQRVMPAVVSVDAIKPSPVGAAKGKPTEESGSGVLVKLEGYRTTFVITNNHVISGAQPGQITVTLNDGRILQPNLVRSDPASDIALLRLESDSLPTADLGDSDRVRTGQWVLAFGSPFGFNQTVTHGIISARDRGQISLGNTIRIKEFLQTDAAINPGNSGGPLVDMNGAVIGINTANASTNGYSSGVAFSIPVNLVKRIGKQLLEKGTVQRGYLGMQMSSALDPHTALRLGLNRLRGAMVESVHPGGPAARAGIQANDVILKIDDVEIRDENHVINLVSVLQPNQRVRMVLWRGKQAVPVDVAVGEWQATAAK
jgi:S1-C subfamily serine protease